MKVNMGTLDRTVRVIVGLLLILSAVMGWVGVWGWLGVVFVATAAVGICPAYLPFGLSTCPRADAAPK